MLFVHLMSFVLAKRALSSSTGWTSAEEVSTVAGPRREHDAGEDPGCALRAHPRGAGAQPAEVPPLRAGGPARRRVGQGIG